jgi:hypothetical protein
MSRTVAFGRDILGAADVDVEVKAELKILFEIIVFNILSRTCLPACPQARCSKCLMNLPVIRTTSMSHQASGKEAQEICF